jgi:hypothetical protein
MQTEETIGTNGDSQVLASTANADYQFDAPQITIEIPHRDSIVSITYKKPELQDYLDRQSATQSTVRYAQGAIMGSQIKHDADTDFFDVVVLNATKRPKTAIKIEREYNRDECLNFPYELKVRAVKMMTTFKWSVKADGDELAGDIGKFTVTQTVGDYEIAYEMLPLDSKVRQGFENAFESKSRVKNGDTLIDNEPHYIEKAIKIFSGDRDGRQAAFISVEGGRLESGPYTPERKGDFTQQIDAQFQLGVITAICDWYGGDQD